MYEEDTLIAKEEVIDMMKSKHLNSWLLIGAGPDGTAHAIYGDRRSIAYSFIKSLSIIPGLQELLEKALEAAMETIKECGSLMEVNEQEQEGLIRGMKDFTKSHLESQKGFITDWSSVQSPKGKD